MSKRKKKKKGRLIPAVIISVALLALISTSFYVGFIYKNAKSWDGLIYPGVKINDIDLGGKTKGEAQELLKTKYGDAVLKKNVSIKTDKKSYDINYGKLNAKYNISDKVEEALKYGKDLKFYKQYKLIKNPVQKQYDLSFTYDGKYIKDIISVMEKDINKDPVNATIEMVSSGKFKITPEIKGYKLQAEKLEQDINSGINGKLGGDITLQAPIAELTAKITADKLHTIDTKVSSFSTNYTTSSYERSNNIELSTKSINGRLLMPGDSFSFNDIVGERTAARGYMVAPVIIGNKVESDLGGGICQVSSTLYNAMLRTPIKSDERIHHTLPSSYVPLGQDATVDWGNLDYKFTNTLEYPIWIEGYVKNKNLYFNIYSNSTFTKKSYTVTNDVYQTINPNTKYIDDPNLAAGDNRIEQKAVTGYKVKVYKTTFENGIQVNQEVVSDDYYRPVDGIIRRGTKK